MRTGRPPKSDAEKKLLGTFDPRFSEEARADRAELKVVALFGGHELADIPPPPAGLHPDAIAEYASWTRRLHEVGRLSRIWLERVTFYAIRRHGIFARLAEGKLPKDGDLKACEIFLKEVGAINVDIPTASQAADEGQFDRFGFAGRVWQIEQERLRAD